MTTNPFEMVPKSYVISINLFRYHDFLDRVNWFPSIQKIGVNGSHLNKKSLIHHRLIKKNNFLRKGEIGCFLSHQKVWLDMIQNQIPFAFIMEDDIDYDKTLHDERLSEIVNVLGQNQNKWDICYTSYYFMRWFDGTEKKDQWNEEIIPTIGWTGLVGYFLTLNGATILYDSTSAILPNDPVDVFIGKLVTKKQLRALRIKPQLCADIYSNSWTSIFNSDTIRIW
jgi:GR25 family glycosyltransferase involved in LPS biosynthesis